MVSNTRSKATKEKARVCGDGGARRAGQKHASSAHQDHAQSPSSTQHAGKSKTRKDIPVTERATISVLVHVRIVQGGLCAANETRTERPSGTQSSRVSVSVRASE